MAARRSSIFTTLFLYGHPAVVIIHRCFNVFDIPRGCSSSHCHKELSKFLFTTHLVKSFRKLTHFFTDVKYSSCFKFQVLDALYFFSFYTAHVRDASMNTVLTPCCTRTKSFSLLSCPTISITLYTACTVDFFQNT